LPLREALSLALLHNPQLAANSWNLRLGEARTWQAGLPPNPELEVEVEEFAGSGARQGFQGAETTIRLSQLVELGGKRGARSRLAGAKAKLAGWDYEAERLALLTETTLSFIDVLAAQEQLRLAKDSQRLAEETVMVVAERVRAGKVSPLEETRAGIERANSRIELARASEALKAARRRLAATWGSEIPRFTRATGTLDEVMEIPPLSAVESLLHQNPAVARWAGEMEQRLAARALERAKRVPNLTASLGVQQFAETDDHSLVLSLGFPLPLFDRNQGSLEEARLRLAQGHLEARNAEIRTGTALAESYSSLTAARTEVLALKTEVVPAAGEIFSGARDGYRQGKFGYLEVLDAQRTLFAANKRLLAALASYHQAVAIVESLIGTRLDTLIPPKPAQPEERP
jgi:cobalt-zinc-cadmium efflux system outer membrane protein